MNEQLRTNCTRTIIASTAYLILSYATGYLLYRVVQAVAYAAILGSAVILGHDWLNRKMLDKGRFIPLRVEPYSLNNSVTQQLDAIKWDLPQGLVVASSLQLPCHEPIEGGLENGVPGFAQIRLFLGNRELPEDEELATQLEKYCGNAAHCSVLKSVISRAWMQQLAEALVIDGRLNSVCIDGAIGAQLDHHKECSIRLWIADDIAKAIQSFPILVKSDKDENLGLTAQLTVAVTVDLKTTSITNSSLLVHPVAV